MWLFFLFTRLFTFSCIFGCVHDSSLVHFSFLFAYRYLSFLLAYAHLSSLVAYGHLPSFFRLCTPFFPFISCFPLPGVVTLGLIRSYTSAPLYRSRCTDIEYMNGIFKLFFFSFFRTGYWIIVFQNANRRRRGLCDQCQNFNISTDPKSYFIFRILSEDGASLASVNRYPRGRNMTLMYAGCKDEYRKTTRILASRRFWYLRMRVQRMISFDRLWTFQFKKFPPKKGFIPLCHTIENLWPWWSIWFQKNVKECRVNSVPLKFVIQAKRRKKERKNWKKREKKRSHFYVTLSQRRVWKGGRAAQ